jgi:hypothetical protein
VVFTLPDAEQGFRPIAITPTTVFAVDEESDGIAYAAKHVQSGKVALVAEHRDGRQVKLKAYLNQSGELKLSKEKV